jgi:ketosteroid isomerase-like protein
VETGTDSRTIIERYFASMRRGQAAENDLLALFADDAVYIEPFTSDSPARGIEAIRARLRKGWETPLPEM